MVKLLLFWFRVTNWIVEFLFSHVGVTKIWKISNYIWITGLKNEKKNKKTKQNVDLESFEYLKKNRQA